MNPNDVLPVPNELADAAKLALRIRQAVWQFLDAAAEKPKPTDYLSPSAIRAIQGNQFDDVEEGNS